ncbi:MAG TPA: methanogen output domain 1-containing protein [Nitrososphaera sp.]|nr:methanogen output domain 1-containing protein [Nitrososphaera sp.]
MASIQDEIGTVGETKEKILERLLGGSKSAGEIAESLQIQKSAARVHLETLQSLGAVRSKFQIEKMGRPKKVYELTEKGREFFPRKYDLFLNLIIDKLSNKRGEAEAREIIESIAEDIASGIRANISKNTHPHDLERSLKIINDVSNQLGFASSLGRDEKDSSFYIQSKNCILHKVASANQDMICHGLHDKLISKSLEDNNSDVRVELKECMALGNEYCRHIIKSGVQK